MSTIIVAAIVIAAVAGITFLLVITNNKAARKKKNALLTSFRQSGTENNLSFSSQELLNNGIIGLDGMHRKLLFLKKENEEIVSKLIIHLDQVKSCKVRKVYGNIGTSSSTKKNGETHLEKIVLQLSLLDPSKPVEIPFYEQVENSLFEMPEKEQKAKDWEAVLSKMLGNHSKGSKDFSTYESSLWQGY